MTAAIRVIWRIRLATILPVFAKGFLAVKESQPVSQLWFSSVLCQYSRQLNQGTDGSARIIRANKAHILKVFRVVMAADDDDVSRFARNLSVNVHHSLLTLRCGSAKLIGS